jgi:hypothetical protein
MTSPLLTRLTFTLFLGTLIVQAQPGPRGGGMGAPRTAPLDTGMRKLFGTHKAWTADAQMELLQPGAASPIVMPVKMAALDGKYRTEMDLTRVQGAGMPPGAAEQIKAMGMASVVSLGRPEKKVGYLIYTDLKAYVETALPEEAVKGEDAFKLELTEAGKETVDGHPCVKSKFVVTDDQGKKREGQVWKATDLNQFPLKLQFSEQGVETTLSFKGVKFDKPAAALFEAPAGFKRYESPQALMQEAVMSRLGQGGGFPPVPKQ